ncbi:carbohydrate ABC transporter permease [Streptacidiphilus carbonis]|jgi:xylobiose transport system permease protein|uniref:carbohydrate ABC transporter permease n=1 Tax=Streptacidiphilus carbonis TaxID=105422 RepID=UPI0005A751DD|nr:carbohydrate ABC transporter permease [Streptacidiphilus carbonis]
MSRTLGAAKGRSFLSLKGNPLAGLGAGVWLVIVLVPLYILVTTSLRTQDEALGGNPLSWPKTLTLSNYKLVLDSGFWGFLVNNVLVTAFTVAAVVVLCVPVAYVVVRSAGRWANFAFRIFLLGLAIPAPVTIVPLYVMIGKMGLYDSLPAIILPTAAFAMPVTLLILVGSMRDISEELYEAMALDGAGQGRILMQLVVPLSRSGLSTVAVFTALNAWNGFIFPLILTQSDNKRVLTTGLYTLSSQYGVNIPATLAAVVLSGIPMFVAYLLARKALISGLMGVGGK